MRQKDPYLELGLDPQATPEQIRAAFRRAIRERHPDTAGGPADGRAVRDAVEAYHLLSDPTTRAAYDTEWRREGTKARPPRAEVRGGRQRTASCRTCAGAGVVMTAVACPGCRGRAEITDLSGRQARVLSCRTCRGRGRVGAILRCPDCDSTGGASGNRT